MTTTKTHAQEFLGLALQAALDAAAHEGATREEMSEELREQADYAGMYEVKPGERRAGQLDEILVNERLITVLHVTDTTITEKRLLMIHNQGGKLIDPTQQDPDWFKTALAPFQRVYAVGKTPEKALRSLGRRIGWGRLTNFEPQEIGSHDLDAWYYRFHAGGTSMKASGRFVPGGVIVDWWK